MTTTTGERCTFESCERPVLARSYCNGHLKQFRSGRELRPLIQRCRPGKAPSRCSFPGCARPHVARGWCTTHYMQIRTSGVVSEPRPYSSGCRADGCPNQHYGLGLCRSHWTAMRREVVAERTFVVLDSDLRRLLDRHRGLCAYCHSRPFEHWDHIIPIARGGAHSIGNLTPACARCNLSKQAKLPIQFRLRKAA